MKLIVQHVGRASFNHVSMFDQIVEKYCKTPEDRAIMITKEHGKYRYLANVEAGFFIEMLSALDPVLAEKTRREIFK